MIFRRGALSDLYLYLLKITEPGRASVMEWTDWQSAFFANSPMNQVGHQEVGASDHCAQALMLKLKQCE